jgi:hypothetical protein
MTWDLEMISVGNVLGNRIMVAKMQLVSNNTYGGGEQYCHFGATTICSRSSCHAECDNFSSFAKGSVRDDRCLNSSVWLEAQKKGI